MFNNQKVSNPLNCIANDGNTVYVFLAWILLLGLIPQFLTSNDLLAQETTEESNTKAARRVIDAFNTGNVSSVSEFISSQYFNHEGRGAFGIEQPRGPESFIDTVKSLRQAFPDLHAQERAMIAQNNMVVSILNLSGTQTGNLFMLPPTGKQSSYEAAHVYKFGEDGKIVEHSVIRDDLPFLAKLGVIGPTSPRYFPFFQALTGVVNNTQQSGSS